MRFLFVLSLAACGPGVRPEPAEERGETQYVCEVTAFFGYDRVKALLASQGIEVTGSALVDMGAAAVFIRGTGMTALRARRILRLHAPAMPFWISWPADHERVPARDSEWICVARIDHEVTPSESVVRRLTDARVPFSIHLGSAKDHIWVASAHHAAAVEALKAGRWEGVEIDP